MAATPARDGRCGPAPAPRRPAETLLRRARSYSRSSPRWPSPVAACRPSSSAWRRSPDCRRPGRTNCWSCGAGQPPASVAKAADLPVDLPALLRGARLPLLRWAKSVRPDASPEVAVLPLRADGPPGASPWTRLVVAFMAGGQVAGYISLVVQAGAADQEARLALAGAGLAASIEALRARAVTEAQGNATASLVRDWLAGRFDHPGELASRANQLGHTPAPPYGVLVLETQRVIPPDGLQRLAHTMSRATPLDSDFQVPAPKERIAPWRRADAAPRPRPSRWRNGEASDHPADRRLLLQAAGALGAVLDERPHRSARSRFPVSVPAFRAAAAAQCTPFLNLPPVVEENARRSSGASAGRQPVWKTSPAPTARPSRPWPRPSPGRRHRVALLRLARGVPPAGGVAPTEELSSFYEDTLGPLVAHDQKSGGELLRTLGHLHRLRAASRWIPPSASMPTGTPFSTVSTASPSCWAWTCGSRSSVSSSTWPCEREVLGELQPGALSHGDVSPSARTPLPSPQAAGWKSGPARPHRAWPEPDRYRDTARRRLELAPPSSFSLLASPLPAVSLEGR